MAEELMELIQRRRSWPLTNREQQQLSASGPRININNDGIGLVNGPRENGRNKTKAERRFDQFMADRSKTDSQRNDERRAGRRQEAYRTEMCKLFMRTGQCQYGDHCRFAHTEEELHVRHHHPNYKTRLCRNFSRNGFCQYGHRCQFIHRTPLNSPHENLRPLARSAYNFNGGFVHGPMFVPQHPLPLFNSNLQYGSVFSAHQLGAQLMVINSPAHVHHNGFGLQMDCSLLQHRSEILISASEHQQKNCAVENLSNRKCLCFYYCTFQPLTHFYTSQKNILFLLIPS